ncbi:hypothetical protein ACFQI7_05785 [Paenibacillus allorhizosphaerae]|uniref:Uncharacterized protein n=1 Tax=Paenibacillus allorhizosphaerae TaxID=2849866 RepID=A0ABN7TDR3_9BACL|nr:hypothetical protein [Paenibacillus allorhizosphaerae]CAG7620462.1 hypothetical protein PAECIP111802_00669 [Paenibacillus allorhizosphaerae]
MFNPKAIAIVLLLCCVLLLAAGCTDHKQLKQDLLQAAQKQEHIQTYRFSGHADMKLDASLFAGMPPLTAAVLSMFKESSIDYSGSVSLLEPLRMESIFKVTPKGSGTPMEIPILLKDNKMYVRLPIVNKLDEYMQVPLGEHADRLKQTGHLGSAIVTKMLEGINPDWLEPVPQEQTAAAKGTDSKTITLKMTGKNEQAATAYFNGIIPSLLDELLMSGLSTDAQHGQWKKTTERLKPTVPSFITVTIDPDGFIREQSGILHLQWDGAASSEINWKHTISDINGTPVFAMEVPKQVKPISEFLRMLDRPKK